MERLGARIGMAAPSVCLEGGVGVGVKGTTLGRPQGFYKGICEGFCSDSAGLSGFRDSGAGLRGFGWFGLGVGGSNMSEDPS